MRFLLAGLEADANMDIANLVDEDYLKSQQQPVSNPTPVSLLSSDSNVHRSTPSESFKCPSKENSPHKITSPLFHTENSNQSSNSFSSHSSRIDKNGRWTPSQQRPTMLKRLLNDDEMNSDDPDYKPKKKKLKYKGKIRIGESYQAVVPNTTLVHHVSRKSESVC